MSQIGTLVTEETDRGVFGKGSFRTLYLNMSFQLAPVPSEDRPSADAPSHRIFVKTEDGAVGIGSAWLRVVENGPNMGDPFYSLTFDDPSFDKPLYLAAFVRRGPARTNPKEVEYEIVWRRPRQKAAPAKGNAAAPSPEHEIPY